MAPMPTTGINDLSREGRAPLRDHGQQLAAIDGTGMEWIVDALQCDVRALRDLELVCGLCAQVIDDLGLHVLGDPLRHAFPHPGGVTALYMLSESHLACHTYPEFGTATFNLYCCRERSPWDWEARLKASLGASRVDVRTLVRGLSRDTDHDLTQQRSRP